MAWHLESAYVVNLCRSLAPGVPRAPSARCWSLLCAACTCGPAAPPTSTTSWASLTHLPSDRLMHGALCAPPPVIPFPAQPAMRTRAHTRICTHLSSIASRALQKHFNTWLVNAWCTLLFSLSSTCFPHLLRPTFGTSGPTRCLHASCPGSIWLPLDGGEKNF